MPREGPLDSEQGVEAYLRLLERGSAWYPALLDVIARWTVSEETVDDVHYRYLIAGEAFDWLRLAQRLLEAAGELVPLGEQERLLFFGLPPDGSDKEYFASAIGAQKHRAHLNFQYGVVIEETLLLAAEREMQKAGAIHGPPGVLPEVAAYERVYGKTFDELSVLYRAETGDSFPERASLAEVQGFTYWCSKFRFRMAEPARVASDTRKAMALLSQMERSRRRLGARGESEWAAAIDVSRDAPAPRAKRRRRAAGQRT